MTKSSTPHSASRASQMAEGLVGSEILKIAADIRVLMAAGKRVCNLTVGDFSASQFSIPPELATGIRDALDAGETNYPPSDGMPALRSAVQKFYVERLALEFPLGSIVIAGGARPVIYATYMALVDPGDTVIYPVPSWNNNHYVHLTGANGIAVQSKVADAFLPTREELEPVIRGARLLSLCSPLNPTGTAFSAEQLGAICDLVLEENARRGANERSLYVMYDQIYWMLTLHGTKHVDPVTLRPKMREYTIFVDGISKCFASTGLRVGWTVAPPDIAARMSSILGHVGAWAPRPEQVATAAFLEDGDAVDRFDEQMRAGVEERLGRLYDGMMSLKRDGFAVDAIKPMGAIYLSARFALRGKHTPDGAVLSCDEDARKYLLDRASLGIVPFQAFGCGNDDGWFRLSVGAVSVREIDEMFPRLRAALETLR
jgi:aspartate aminotransferase